MFFVPKKNLSSTVQFFRTYAVILGGTITIKTDTLRARNIPAWYGPKRNAFVSEHDVVEIVVVLELTGRLTLTCPSYSIKYIVQNLKGLQTPTEMIWYPRCCRGSLNITVETTVILIISTHPFDGISREL